jgi:hypothetical protein
MNSSFIQTFTKSFFANIVLCLQTCVAPTGQLRSIGIEAVNNFYQTNITGKAGELNVHENSVYHRNSADRFCKVFQIPSQSIVNLLISDRMKVIEDNRQRLRPIINHRNHYFYGSTEFRFSR